MNYKQCNLFLREIKHNISVYRNDVAANNFNAETGRLYYRTFYGLRSIFFNQRTSLTLVSSHLTISDTTIHTHIYLEVITRLFLYQPVYQARASITARGIDECSCRPKA